MKPNTLGDEHCNHIYCGICMDKGYAKALDDVEKVVKRMRAGLIPDRKEWNKGWDNACDFLLDELEEIAKLLKSTNNYQISSSKLAKEKS